MELLQIINNTNDEVSFCVVVIIATAIYCRKMLAHKDAIHPHFVASVK